MSAPRPCEHCGTMLQAGRFGTGMWWEDTSGKHHNTVECLRAQLAERTRQRDEAIRLGLEVCDEYPAETSASETFIEAAHAALERLRHV